MRAGRCRQGRGGRRRRTIAVGARFPGRDPAGLRPGGSEGREVTGEGRGGEGPPLYPARGCAGLAWRRPGPGPVHAHWPACGHSRGSVVRDCFGSFGTSVNTLFFCPQSRTSLKLFSPSLSLC